VKLKDETNLITQKAKQIAMTVDFNTIHRDMPLVCLVESAEEVEKSALAAARRTTERNGLPFASLEACPLQYGYGTIVVTLPNILCAQHNAPSIFGLQNFMAHSNRSASTARTRMA
jgi:hypothetical protein